ncbi:type II/IV secretion system protein, PilT/PilU family [Candidatus Campylobacter infans]|uniref:Type II/IV secretion system protein, PilT/PilU family n=1 Tax=Candidatus Campylobacter infans TaxID=2561898 RepID=A0A7H9CJE4_9BACT|nr:PilT/PilU family type 4a pilus ATPase [Candidatus Campylobacter infans]KAF0589991.1 MAG: type II/IV secretion system protein, PilT/PilU family [Candidatus Campylobacter infans]QLI06102.1 type II/IV secretion system protein, PilT/PilU family [Candidatus Campylobacter infans]
MSVDVSKLDFKLRDELNGYLEELISSHGSDLHVKANSIIRKRVNGELYPVENARFISTAEGLTLAKELLRGRFDELISKKSVDFTYKLNENFRFRSNIFFQMDGVSAVFRVIPTKIPPLESLGLPESVKNLCDHVHRGMILVTGPTGSGKSTTLASMIDYINNCRKSHIITIEDPIEFIHEDRGCVINQRSVGQDTPDFASALRAALREDPDIILVGEIRDLETLTIALMAAETGHLVLATLHTKDAQETINRILGMFKGPELEHAKMSCADVIQGVISQRLCRRKDGGRVAAVEIMLQSPRIKQLILKSRQDEIGQAIVESGESSGMQTFDRDLLRLFNEGVITKENALMASSKPNDLAILIQQAHAKMTGVENERDVISLKDVD